MLLAGATACGSEPTPPYASATAAVTEPLSDAAFLTAAACQDCRILARSQVSLPETGVSATTAKLLSASAGTLQITLAADGTVVDENTLLARERKVARDKYGKHTKRLYNLLPAIAADKPLWVAIWGAVPPNRSRREELAASPEAATADARRNAAALQNAAAPILSALSERRALVTENGSNSPFIRALVRPADISLLEQLPEVAMLDADGWPGSPTGTAWYQTIGAASAHTNSTGLNETICVVEGSQPDDYSQLLVQSIASPTGYADAHTRWTTGIMRSGNFPADSVANESRMVVGNWDLFTAPGGVMEWCRNNTARVINFSWSFSDGSAGGQSGFDWQQDWLELHAPFPLFVAAAGNAGGTATVENRNYNGLVVGGLDDRGTVATADDIAWSGTSWKNFTTTHNDYELPHLLAPSVNITAVGITRTGTSAAAPQVSATAALVTARDKATFDAWPEMTRAVIMATATEVIGTPIRKLPVADSSVGVGGLNTVNAVALAAPAMYGTTNLPSGGRYAKTVTFATDFTGSGFLSQNFTTGPVTSSGRMRVVIAFDATPGGCDQYGANCSGTTLDADLDLYVYDGSTLVGTSTSFDSSYEFLDFAKTSGHSYTFKVQKNVTHSNTTYLGISWFAY